MQRLVWREIVPIVRRSEVRVGTAIRHATPGLETTIRAQPHVSPDLRLDLLPPARCARGFSGFPAKLAALTGRCRLGAGLAWFPAASRSLEQVVSPRGHDAVPTEAQADGGQGVVNQVQRDAVP